MRFGRCLGYIALAVVMANAVLIVFTQAWPSQQSAYAHVRDHVHDPDMIWTDPYYGQRTLVLDMDSDDFRASETRAAVRTGLAGYPIQRVYAESRDPYVVRVQDYLDGIAHGRTDMEIIRTVLSFVRTAIRYSEDMDTYGTEDRLAFPMETLYLGRGDCEDTSILFAAVMIQMGYPQVLLDYPGHMAQAVVYDGRYRMCETAADSIPDMPGDDLSIDGRMPHILDPQRGSSVAGFVYDVQQGYRNGLDSLKRWLGF